ncbi:MAG: DUF3016 domain-containing protein [Azoarcus sp.]|nr:DUF3016 domain-containing protein [Azoarcus sp.]
MDTIFSGLPRHGQVSLPGAYGGTATVDFIAPEHYTDSGYGDRESAENLRALAGHLQRLAGKSLAANEVLHVDIIDIDLAGHVRRIGRHLEEVRVIDGRTDWPTIMLRYRLERGGMTVLEGEESLSDMSYFLKLNTYPPSEILRHEKALLDQWLDTRILKRASL